MISEDDKLWLWRNRKILTEDDIRIVEKNAGKTDEEIQEEIEFFNSLKNKKIEEFKQRDFAPLLKKYEVKDVLTSIKIPKEVFSKLLMKEAIKIEDRLKDLERRIKTLEERK